MWAIQASWEDDSSHIYYIHLLRFHLPLLVASARNRGNRDANNLPQWLLVILLHQNPPSSHNNATRAMPSLYKWAPLGEVLFPQFTPLPWAALNSRPTFSVPRTHLLSISGLLALPSISLCVCSSPFAIPFPFMAFQITFFLCYLGFKLFPS